MVTNSGSEVFGWLGGHGIVQSIVSASYLKFYILECSITS